MPQKLLITGRTRSGTTFLTNFLNAQEEITLFSDIFHVVAGKFLSQPVQTKVINYHKKLTSKEKDIYLHYIKVGLEMLGDKTNYKLQVKPEEFTTAKELYELLLDSIHKPGDKVVGHKVTEVEINVENILSNTDMKVLYIIRDPRDAVLSAVKKFGNSVFHAVTSWKKAIDKILKINSNKLLVIRFEDLIKKDLYLKSKLEGFLGINIDYNINEAKSHENKSFIGNSSFSDVDKLFDLRAVERWKNRSEFIVKYIYMETLDYIQKLGYDYMELDKNDFSIKQEVDKMKQEHENLVQRLGKNKQQINKLLFS
ncbi:sulfotransferase [Halothermothrix orenii]|uniref:Sulfotransferase n=1 Tax=Halothermothrix orenii (strain H 168 / OCM 544 / DSM 9562) TaxID=373903 RepID=B8CYT1_HALOH|nr:sulfotransferase [Halothermothrix orenii]ACL70450.1 hypothetical protein Hore_17010 [Halothermothrix orenii H 168]